MGQGVEEGGKAGGQKRVSKIMVREGIVVLVQDNKHSYV